MHLQIIALPTYYDGEKHKNVGDVYYVKEKRVLFSQNKTFPFIQYKNGQSETDVKEMIVKNKEIHVLHIDGIGRIVFPICKDVLVDKYMSICILINAVTQKISSSFLDLKINYIINKMRTNSL